MKKSAPALVLLALILSPGAIFASDFTMSTVIARVTALSKTVDEQTGVVTRSTVTQRKYTYNPSTQTIETDEFTTECPGDRCFRPEFLTCPYTAFVLVHDDPAGPRVVYGLQCVPTTIGACGQVNGSLKEDAGVISLVEGILYSSRGCGT